MWKSIRETSSHALRQGAFGHSRLSSPSHCGLILTKRVELVCASLSLPIRKKEKHRRGLIRQTSPSNPRMRGKSHHHHSHTTTATTCPFVTHVACPSRTFLITYVVCPFIMHRFLSFHNARVSFFKDNYRCLIVQPALFNTKQNKNKNPKTINKNKNHRKTN